MALVAVLTVMAMVWPRTIWVPVPTGSVRLASGESVSLAARLAPVSLVHFWATWCGPCRTEVPALLSAWPSDRAEWSLLMVAVDDAPAEIATFWAGLDDLGMVASSSVVYDDRWSLAKAFGTEALPETHLVVDGQVARSWVGPQAWTREMIERAVEVASGARR